jgi:hypothetical protein
MKHWNQEDVQQCLVRIVLMPLIYVSTSWAAMMLKERAIYTELVRDCYEALVLYQFFTLLVQYLRILGPEYCDHVDLRQLEQQAMEEGVCCQDDSDSDSESLEGTADEQVQTIVYYVERANPYKLLKHQFPLCCLPRMRVTRGYFLTVKQGILQYVLVRPITTLIAILLNVGDYYRAGNFSPRYGYLWLTLINNASVAVALYCLVLFFTHIYDIIKPQHPLRKLVAIKIMLFFMFWQSVAIAALYYLGLLPELLNMDKHGSVALINNMLVCCESLVLAVGQFWVFPYAEYRDDDDRENPAEWHDYLSTCFRQILNPRDILDDTRTTFTEL